MPDLRPDRPLPVRPRLQGANYRTGCYFVTICVEQHTQILGEIKYGHAILNDLGKAVAETWRWIDSHPAVVVSPYIVMPNHTHALITITNEDDSDSHAVSLSRVITAFKRRSAQRMSALAGIPGLIWQRGYHDHIIRSPKDRFFHERYIVENPVRWAMQRGQEVR